MTLVWIKNPIIVFLKADGSARYGIGAYYGSDYAANGRATVVDMWMTKMLGEPFMRLDMPTSLITIVKGFQLEKFQII